MPKSANARNLDVKIIVIKLRFDHIGASLKARGRTFPQRRKRQGKMGQLGYIREIITKVSLRKRF